MSKNILAKFVLLLMLFNFFSCNKRSVNVDKKKWTKISFSRDLGGTLPNQVPIDLFYINNTIFFGGADGIYHSHDGVTWTKDLGIPFNQVSQHFARNAFGNVFVGTTDGVYYLSSGGTNEVGLGPALWLKLNPLVTHEDAANIAISGNNIIFTEVLREIVSPLSNPAQRDTFYLNASKIVNQENEVFTVGDDYIWKSANNGNTWLPMTRIGLPTSYTVRSAFVGAGKLFIGTLDGDIYYLTLSGGSWVKAVIPQSTGGTIKFASTATDMFFASPQGIFISKDFGVTWVKDNDDVTFFSAFNFTIGPDKVYAILGDGLYTRTL